MININNWHLWVGTASGVLQILSNVPYIISILKGKTRPNIVSYIIWTTVQLVNIVSIFMAGASWSVIQLMVMTLNTIFIIVLCLKGYGYKEYTWLDWVCLGIAFVAIGILVFASKPLIALACGISIEVIATIPTLVKTYRHPETELAFAWFIMVFASILAFISTTRFDFQNLVFPTIYFVQSGLIAGLAFWGQRRIALSKA